MAPNAIHPRPSLVKPSTWGLFHPFIHKNKKQKTNSIIIKYDKRNVFNLRNNKINIIYLFKFIRSSM